MNSHVYWYHEIGFLETIYQSGYEYVKTVPDPATVLEAILQLMTEPQPDDALMASIGTYAKWISRTCSGTIRERSRTIHQNCCRMDQNLRKAIDTVLAKRAEHVRLHGLLCC